MSQSQDVLVEYLSEIRIKKKLIVTSFISFMVLGLVLSLSLRNEYRVSSTFIPQLQNAENSSSGVGALASLAGIQIGGNSNSEIPADLYPKIVNSKRFALSAIERKIYVSEIDDSVTFKTYYHEFYEPDFYEILNQSLSRFLSSIKGIFLSKEISIQENSRFKPFQLDDPTNEVITFFTGKININVSAKDKVIDLSFDFYQPQIALQMHLITDEILKESLVEYKTRSARDQLRYTERVKDEKLEELKISQEELSQYRDSNLSLSTSMSQSRLKILESNFAVKQNVYSEILNKYEEARLLVNSKKPIFTILESPYLPNDRYSPARSIIILVFGISGLILSVLFILLRKSYKELKLN